MGAAGGTTANSSGPALEDEAGMPLDVSVMGASLFLKDTAQRRRFSTHLKGLGGMMKEYYC